MKQKYYSYLSKRSKPLNYSKENAKLFEHELRKKIDSPGYKTLNSRYVKNSTIRRYKYFRTNTSAWRMNPINHLPHHQLFQVQYLVGMFQYDF